MIRSRVSLSFLFLASLSGSQTGRAQGKADTLPDKVNSIDTVVINEKLPRYIVRWTDKHNQSNEEHPSPNLEGQIEIRREGDTTLIQLIADPAKGEIADVKGIDVNFDGYTDLQLDFDNAGVNRRSYFFLFDKTQGRFKSSDAFSRFANAAINPKDSLILSSISRGGHGDEYEYYKVLNGLPVLVKREVNSTDTSLTARLINGTMTTTKQIIYAEKQDSAGNWYREVIYQELIDSVLQPVKKQLLRSPHLNEPSRAQRRNGLYRADFRGAFLLQEEENYKYAKDKDGRKYREIVRKKVTHNKLKVLKKTREYLN